MNKSEKKHNVLLYIAQTVDKKFLVFKIGKNDKKWELIKIVKSDYTFNNLFYDKNNGIIYAGLLGRVIDHSGITEYYKKYGNLNYKRY